MTDTLSNPFYIYGLFDSALIPQQDIVGNRVIASHTIDQDSIRYIGQTVYPVVRLSGHVFEIGGNCTFSKKDVWISQLISGGRVPMMVILDIATAGTIDEKECEWISKFQKKHIMNRSRGRSNTIKRMESLKNSRHSHRKAQPDYVFTHSVGELIYPTNIMGEWLNRNKDRITKIGRLNLSDTPAVRRQAYLAITNSLLAQAYANK